jgi:hypothetical protein
VIIEKMQLCLHQWVDARDLENNWLIAIVKKRKQNRYLIHYRGWKDKYDEWLDMTNMNDAKRLAPLYTFVKPPFLTYVNFLPRVSIATKVWGYDTSDQWVRGIITAQKIINKDEYVYLEYEDWSARYNEWIPIHSGLVTPLNACILNDEVSLYGMISSPKVNSSPVVLLWTDGQLFKHVRMCKESVQLLKDLNSYLLPYLSQCIVLYLMEETYALLDDKYYVYEKWSRMFASPIEKVQTKDLYLMWVFLLIKVT